MGENPVNVIPEFESLNMNTIRCRLKDLSTSVDDILSSSEDSISQLQMLLDNFNHNLLVLNEDPDVDALSQDALESYIEQVNKELHSTEEENVKISREIDTLKTRVSTDSDKLDGDLEALSTLLSLIDSKGMFSNQNSIHAERSFSGGVLGSQMQDSEEYKFKVLELSQEIERNRSKLTTLEDLNHSLKRLDTSCSFGDLFCGVKCIQYEDNCIKLSLRTPISSMDFSSIMSKLDCSMELTHLDHELFIEITEKMELKNVEIFPADVHLDGIINTLNSSRFWPITALEDNLGWLLRQIQQHIILCTLRRLLAKDASNSRCSVTYSDPEGMITAHLGCGLVASLKVSHGWPLSNCPLMLRSLKHSDKNSKSISSSLLYEIQEQANSLDIQTRRELKHFIESIEQLVMKI
ncbi:hypothetical protein KSP39_PZI005419 [Platanthera zijinensis]|uniref:Uncharacterized protein n=1 Tax=Platanthera zijinensis TaxID=2320716 RepID=A0AAP0BT18_9ASPA